MKVHFPPAITGQQDTLVVLEVEFTSKARRVVVTGFEGLEPLDLNGEKPGGTYEVLESLPRLHVPMRVTRNGPGKGVVTVRVEDVKGIVAPESTEVPVTLEAPVAATGNRNKVWILVAFAAIVTAIGVFVVAPLFKAPTVPSVVGKPRDEAVRSLKVLGYVQMVRSVEVGEDDASKDGLVIGQEPAAGSDLPRGSTVEIRVAHRKEGGVAVPDFVAKGLSDAEELAKSSGFTLGIDRADASDDQIGKVLRQKPAAGARAAAGSTVAIVIGQKRTAGDREVPDVTALSPADAERTLSEAKFQVTLREEDAGPEKAGKVLRQSPAGGTKAAENAKVELVVGRDMGAPAALVDMPDTLEKSEAEALKALTDAGFLPHVTYGAGAEGKVVAQMPPAGLAPKGGNVELTVGRSSATSPAVPPAVPPTPPTAPPVPPVEPPAVPPAVPPTPPVEPPAVPPAVPPTAPPAVPPSVPPAVPPAVPPTAPPAVPPAPGLSVAPDVIGLDRLKAQGDLQHAGIAFRVTFEETPEDTAAGIVLTTNPRAGENVPAGTTLELVVSRHAAPRPHTVPDVVTKSEWDASDALRKETFHVKITYVESAQKGLVLTQDPPAGALAEAGAWVSLTVGKGGPPPSSVPAPPPVVPPTPPVAPPTPPVEPPVVPPVVPPTPPVVPPTPPVEPPAVPPALPPTPPVEPPATPPMPPVEPPAVPPAPPVEPPAIPPTPPVEPPAIPPTPPVEPPAVPPTPPVEPPVLPPPPPVEPPVVPPALPPAPPVEPPHVYPPAPALPPVVQNPNLPPAVHVPPGGTIPRPTPVATAPRVVAAPPSSSNPNTAPLPAPTSTQPATAPRAAPRQNVARSDGTQTVVPDVRGYTATEAIAILLQRGLAPDVSGDRDPRAVVGQVRTQSPSAGSTVATATRVALSVGTGYSASMSDVPSVVGLTTAEAAARLGASGYTAQVVRAQGRPGVYSRGDVVVAQFPAGRSTREQANPVTLWIIGP